MGGLGLDESSAGAGKVLLLALAGRVGLAQPAAVMAVEGALSPVHLADWAAESVVD